MNGRVLCDDLIEIRHPVARIFDGLRPRILHALLIFQCGAFTLLGETLFRVFRLRLPDFPGCALCQFLGWVYDL